MYACSHGLLIISLLAILKLLTLATTLIINMDNLEDSSLELRLTRALPTVNRWFHAGSREDRLTS